MTRIADDIKRETVFRSRVFDVERRTYDAGEGKTKLREYVVHPGAVVVVARLDDGRFVMIRNMRRAVDEELLELAAGTREAPETPAETAARELEEETGYKAGRIEPFIEFFTTPGFCTERMYSFIATELQATQQNLQGGERIRVELMDEKLLRQAVYDGTLRDGKTLAVLGAYFLRNSD